MAATGPSSPDAPKESAAASAAAAKSVASESTPAATSDDAAADAKPAAAAPAPAAAPTYLSTKASRAYTLSKQLLSAGALDDALSTLEMALQLSRQMLDETLKAGGDDSEMHESLAPLYYLYGTTLLYSVEESDVMMASGQAGMAAGAADAAGGGGAGDIEVPDEGEAAAGKSEEGGDANEEGEEEEAPAVADPAEDLQIAWENLDLARTIVTRLVAPFADDDDDNADDGAVVLKSNHKNEESNNGSEYTPEQQKELLLDLAQVHVRLGDLQRADGNVLPSLPDYDAALKLRVRCLGPFDRKVADSHFSLAGVYAEAPSRAGENEGKVDRFVNSLAAGGMGANADGMGGGEGTGTELTEDEKREFRVKSLEHYLACGRAFVGILAGMCGEDAAQFTDLGNEDGGAATAGAAASTAAAATGHCKSMAALRARLATLTPPASPAARAEFDDLKEMIDEIQEAMDTAEETEAGLRSLGEMKANEIKKHEAKQNGEGVEEEGEGGATTTIGFGAPSGSGLGAASAAGTVNAFGSTAATTASAATATAAPMMVIKKKKKKPVAPAPAEDSAKRLKTN